MRIPIVLTAIVATVALAACATAPGQSPTPAGPTSGAPTSGPATSAASPAASAAADCTGTGGGQQVSIVDSAFSPTTVSVAVGGEVTWTHNGALPHTVTLDDGPNCGTLNSGDTVSHVFSTVGTFDYHCNIHSSMQATVTVTP